MTRSFLPLKNRMELCGWLKKLDPQIMAQNNDAELAALANAKLTTNGIKFKDSHVKTLRRDVLGIARHICKPRIAPVAAVEITAILTRLDAVEKRLSTFIESFNPRPQ